MSELTPEDVREILRLVDESRFDEFELETPTLTIRFRRDTAPAQAPAVEAPAAAANGLAEVTSPMVGTFYRAAQPGAPPFVEIGDVVAPGQTLCILEAMKLMNEVKAEVEGVVRGVHAENAEPVEFGQLLFELEPLVGRPAL